METLPAASRGPSDRLSDLPDSLLHCVLSSLRSRQVVQTCLLSQRWRHLWRFVPCLDVDQRDFDPEPQPEFPYDLERLHLFYYNNPNNPTLTAAEKERIGRQINRQRSFEDFADSVLPLCLNAVWPLDAFRLHVADTWNLSKASYRWIRRALAARPAELRVAYGDLKTKQQTDPWFGFNLVSGGAGALPLTSRLRKLHLSGVILSDEFPEELRSECPVLEDLKLVNCNYKTRFHGHIASRSLKRLHIEGGYDHYSSLRHLDPLHVPALVSLNLVKFCLPNTEDELQSLAVASIIVDSDNKYISGPYTFLKSMRNARVLELRSFTASVLLGNEPHAFREFHNLRNLILVENVILQRDAKC